MVDAELTARFEELRPTLLRLAYRLLGSLSEAEDIVQEAWLRLSRTVQPSEVRDLRAFMTTTVTRLSYDLLASARARRESYVGPWVARAARAGARSDRAPHAR